MRSFLLAALFLAPTLGNSGVVVVEGNPPPPSEKWQNGSPPRGRSEIVSRNFIIRGGTVYLSPAATILDHIAVGNVRALWPLTLMTYSIPRDVPRIAPAPNSNP